MIHWIASNRFWLVRYSRWVLAACAFALVGITQLPHNLLGRLLAIGALCVVAIAFSIWLSVALITIFCPRLFDKVHRKTD